MRIKITTGFGDDEKFTIESNEAHKAYYLFNNPEKRGVFSNGVALSGKDIRSIQPDYHATMGWNPSHKLDDDDWNDIRKKGVDEQIEYILSKAKEISYLCEKQPELLNQSLKDIPLLNNKSSELSEGVKKLADKFKIN